MPKSFTINKCNFAMEIKDLIGLEKPLTVLVQAFCDGCSSLFSPIINQIEANNQRKQKEADNNLELINSIKNACAEELKSSIASKRTYRELHNISSIYSQAINEIKALPNYKSKEFKPIDPDWSSMFFDYASKCSNADIQVLWSKILANECSGTEFFKRTLWILYNIEAQEAKWLVELAPMVINKMLIPHFVYEKNKFFDYNKIQSLQDCGCINSGDCKISIQSERAKDSVVGCKVVTDKTISNISFTGLSLTDSGFELLSLIENVKPNEQFVELLKNEVNKKYGDNVKIVPLV